VQGDYATAQRLLEEARSLQRQVGDRLGLAHSLNNLGKLAWAQGNTAAAQCLYEESLVIRRGLGNPWGIAESLINLGKTALAQRNYAMAHVTAWRKIMLLILFMRAWMLGVTISGNQ